jgi:hypothetical protein
MAVRFELFRMPKLTNQTGDSLKGFAFWLLALFLTVWGAQLWVVWLYGSPIPIWDQWYEADSIFKPWAEGHLRGSDLVAVDSNNRAVMTNLLDLFVIRLNGRWDPLLQMTVNALIHAAFACGLAFCLWNFFGRKRGWLVCFLLMPFFALPYGGENAIWGYNSMWYFVSIFALITVTGLGFARMGTWRWWLGFAAAILGLLTMASGLVAPAVAGGLILLRAIKNRRMERHEMITFGTGVILTVLGIWIVGMSAYNRPLQAHSWREFTAALTHNLNWPFVNIPGMVFIIALPLVLLLVLYLRPGFQATRVAELILALALWSALQSAMIAYGRANYVPFVAGSRYMDVFNIFVIASLFATVLLGQFWEYKHLQRWDGLWLPLIFAGIIFFGLCRVSRFVVDDVLVVTREWNLIAEERVEAFIKTGDEQELFQEPTVRPDPKITLSIITNPKLQAILPPVCLSPKSSVAAGRFSAISRWLLKHSITILSGGLILFVGLCGYGLACGTLGLTPRMPAGILALLAGLLALGFVWSKRPLHRESVERDLRQQLSAYFKAANNPARAAIHERKAEELNPDNQFAN